MINETMKKWTKKLTQEEYDLRVLTPKEFCTTYKVKRAEYKLRLEKLNG